MMLSNCAVGFFLIVAALLVNIFDHGLNGN